MRIYTITLMFIATFLLGFNNIQAQEQIIIFHTISDPYCRDVTNFIEQNNLNDTLDILMVEADDDNFMEYFSVAFEECGMDETEYGFPTMYYNKECTLGSVEINTKLSQLAGIETEEEFQEEVIIEKIVQEEEETNIEDRSLEEIVITEIEREPRPFSHILMIIIGPALLIFLGYLIIKKLNL